MSFFSKALPAPTADEQARIDACKRFGCLACYLDGMGSCGVVEYHHITIAGRTYGHRYGFSLGAYHHRRQPFEDRSPTQLRASCGPSLLDGSKAFYAHFGSPQQLLDRMDQLIGWPRVLLQRQRGPGRGKPSSKTGHQNGRSAQASSKTFPRPPGRIV